MQLSKRRSYVHGGSNDNLDQKFTQRRNELQNGSSHTRILFTYSKRLILLQSTCIRSYLSSLTAAVQSVECRRLVTHTRAPTHTHTHTYKYICALIHTYTHLPPPVVMKVHKHKDYMPYLMKLMASDPDENIESLSVGFCILMAYSVLFNHEPEFKLLILLQQYICKIPRKLAQIGRSCII